MSAPGLPKGGPLALRRQVTRSGFDEEPEESAAAPLGSPFVARSPDAPTPPRADAVVDLKIGACTDPGGSGKENQDAFFLARSADSRAVFLGVLDGHGRELGRVASMAASAAMEAELRKDGAVDKLLASPRNYMVDLFRITHAAIQKAYGEHYTRLGATMKAADGFLLVRQRSSQPWSCVHGGSTATLVAVVDGRHLYCANVGDSSAMVGGWSGIASSAVKGSPTGDTAMPPPEATAVGGVDVAHISSDHSPECPSEFRRVRAFRPSKRRGDETPELMFVYDAFSYSKHACNPVFQKQRDGSLAVTNAGRYYKNVRSEWASLVTTPAHSKYQDALAFTRSLGDFHLQTYGVLHEPDVWYMDLAEGARSGKTAVMFVCTDGVWDNWVYEDAVKWMLQPERVAEVTEKPDAESVTSAFMQENYDRAIANFGSQADNMTAICCYLFPTTPASSSSAAPASASGGGGGGGGGAGSA